MLNSNELFEYYLKRKDFMILILPLKKVETLQNITDKFRNRVGKEGKVFQSLLNLTKLEGS